MNGTGSSIDNSQDANVTRPAMISSLKELYNYLLDDFYEIHDIQFLNESKAQIFYSERGTTFRY